MTTTTNWIQPHEPWKDAPSYWAADILTSTEANGALGHKEEVLVLKAQEEPARLTPASERPQLDLDEDEKTGQTKGQHLAEIMRNFSTSKQKEKESNIEWYFPPSETLNKYFNNLRSITSTISFKKRLLDSIIDPFSLNKEDKQNGPENKYFNEKPDQSEQANRERETGPSNDRTFDFQREVDPALPLKFDWRVQPEKPETIYLEIETLTKGWISQLGETIETHRGTNQTLPGNSEQFFTTIDSLNNTVWETSDYSKGATTTSAMQFVNDIGTNLLGISKFFYPYSEHKVETRAGGTPQFAHSNGFFTGSAEIDNAGSIDIKEIETDPYGTQVKDEFILSTGNEKDFTAERPTLVGEAQLGQTIRIDDANLDRSYRTSERGPTKNYTWEISNDKGKTWAALNNNDANDGNKYLTLTSQSVGKKIRGVINYRDEDGNHQIDVTDPTFVKAHPMVWGNSLYTLVDGPSWIEAENNSVKLGGHLITINDSNENKFAATLIEGFQKNQLENQLLENKEDYLFSHDKPLRWDIPETIGASAWIGLSGAARSKDYFVFDWEEDKWSSGQNSDFRANQSIFPLSYAIQDKGPRWSQDYYYSIISGNEYDRFNWTKSDPIGGNSSINPYVSDKGIAEIPFIRRGDSAYVIVEGSTRKEAEASAQALGGHLAAFENGREEQWIIESLLNDHSINHIGRTYRHKKEESWLEPYKEVFGHSIWPTIAQTIKDNIEIHLSPFNHIFSKHPLFEFWNLETGLWPGRAIVEIPLPSNNSPSGKPLLTGDFKTGETISIEIKEIEDGDNFELWIPTFEYSWEVSDDDGATWSALTSNDAVDGDDSFTITGTEAGKHIRSMVRYLDGYGTRETIVSSPQLIEINENGEVPIDAQEISLNRPELISLRSGYKTTTAITYNVAETNNQLTGISASLYFNSTQISIDFSEDPYQPSLLGYDIAADTTDGDSDPATDSVLALTYTDFMGNFPGEDVTLPLTLAELSLTPTANYSGTTLNLTGTGATDFKVIGDRLTLEYDATPVVAQPIDDQVVDALSDWSYRLPANLFFDPDSELTLSLQSDLPSWLSYDPNTTTFSGTPTSSVDSVSIDLSAADDLGHVSTALNLKIRDVQVIEAQSNTVDYQAGESLALPLSFNATDGQASTGLAFQLHYDSSLFTFTSIDSPISGMTIFEYDTSPDLEDADKNQDTDTVLNVTIASFDGSLSAGTPIGNFNFEVADLPPADPDQPDPITGVRPSVMNITASSTATGYGFAADPITLEPLLFNLDVDGDGAVTALGDGLMVIRKLFGPAFSDEALTNKAISRKATRTTQEIHDYIQNGIDGGYLDVDIDNDITALGDGLMVIRHLFGPAFSNEKLIDKAISPRSQMMPQGRDFSMMAIPDKADLALQVAGRIDALIPGLDSFDHL